MIWEVLNLKFVAPRTTTPCGVMLPWAYSCTTPGDLEGNSSKRKIHAFAGLTLGPLDSEKDRDEGDGISDSCFDDRGLPSGTHSISQTSIAVDNLFSCDAHLT